MWSRSNAVGMRQRWGSLENAPGRTAASGGTARRPGAGSGAQAGRARATREFYRREIVIDCIDLGCPGIYVTASREVQAGPGSGSKVVLRCSRGIEAHDVALTQKPYDDRERQALISAAGTDKPVCCPRCETTLEPLAENGAAEASGKGTSTGCPWCGVRWHPNGQERGALQMSMGWLEI